MNTKSKMCAGTTIDISHIDGVGMKQILEKDEIERKKQTKIIIMLIDI